MRALARFGITIFIALVGSWLAVRHSRAASSVQTDLQTYFAAQVEPRYATTTQFSFGVTGDLHLSQVLTKTSWQVLLGKWRDEGKLFGVIVGDMSYGATEDLANVVNGWSEVP